MTIFRATFYDVDYPNRDIFEQFFQVKESAVNWVCSIAKDHDIIKPNWKTSGDSLYFNHQFNDHKTQNNACYHSSVEQVEVL